MKNENENGNGNGISRRSRNHDQALRTGKKKLPFHVVDRTSECSCRASIAPAGWTRSGLRASSGGWAEGPMAPVVTTDAATVDQCCSFKHQTGWRTRRRHESFKIQVCVSSYAGARANLLSIIEQDEARQKRNVTTHLG